MLTSAVQGRNWSYKVVAAPRHCGAFAKYHTMDVVESPNSNGGVSLLDSNDLD